MVSFLKEEKLAYKWKNRKKYRNKLSYLIQKSAMQHFYRKNSIGKKYDNTVQK